MFFCAGTSPLPSRVNLKIGIPIGSGYMLAPSRWQRAAPDKKVKILCGFDDLEWRKIASHACFTKLKSSKSNWLYSVPIAPP